MLKFLKDLRNYYVIYLIRKAQIIYLEFFQAFKMNANEFNTLA